MKDFMTKISDYLNERRNDPERRENQLSIVIIGAVAVVVIILLLLLFWTYTVKERERKQKEAAKEALLEAEMQMKVPVEEEELVAETHEEKAEEYMSQNDGREQELKELALLRVHRISVIFLTACLYPLFFGSLLTNGVFPI